MADSGRDSDDIGKLVRRARCGDKSAEQELLVRHRGQLRRMISVFLDPRVAKRVDPSDVLQETFIDVARRLPDFQDDMPGGFYAWMRQIAKDRIIDMHRKHIHSGKRSVSREMEEPSCFSAASAQVLAERLVSNASSPTKQAERTERRAQIQAALQRVSEDYRELLMMRYVEQLSTREIAGLLAITESAVKSRLWRALERMKHLLATNERDAQ